MEFRNPVDIGDLLTFDSAVMHAQNLPQHSAGPRGRVHVEVQACVVRPERQAAFPTNAFQFTCAPCAYYVTMSTLKPPQEITPYFVAAEYARLFEWALATLGHCFCCG